MHGSFRRGAVRSGTEDFSADPIPFIEAEIPIAERQVEQRFDLVFAEEFADRERVQAAFGEIVGDGVTIRLAAASRAFTEEATLASKPSSARSAAQLAAFRASRAQARIRWQSVTDTFRERELRRVHAGWFGDAGLLQAAIRDLEAEGTLTRADRQPGARGRRPGDYVVDRALLSAALRD